MAISNTALAAATADLAGQFKRDEIDEAAYATALAALWAEANSVVPVLGEKIDAQLAIKAAMIEAYQAGIGVKGKVSAVSALPAEAAEGVAYIIDDVTDEENDQHLFARVAGAWEDLGKFSGPTGRSAYDVAVANGYEGTEQEFALDPIDKAILAATAADEADAVRLATIAVKESTDLVRTQTLAAKGDTEAASAAALTVVDASASVFTARDQAAVSRAAADAARDTVLAASAALPADNPRESYAFVIEDVARRALLRITEDGELLAKLGIEVAVSNGLVVTRDADGVTRLSLGSEEGALPLPGGLSVNGQSEYDGWQLVFTDAARRLLLGVRNDGTVVGKGIGDPTPVAVAISNGLTVVQTPDGVTTFSLGTEEGKLPLPGGVGIDAQSDFDGWLFTIAGPGRQLLLGITVDGTVVGKGIGAPPDALVASVAALTAEIGAARGSRATLLDRLAQSTTSRGYPISPFANEAAIRDWRWTSMKAETGAGRAVLALLGDSWTTRNGYVQSLTTRLQAALGNGGPGYVTFARSFGALQSTPAGGGATVTYTGTWSEGTAAASRGPDMGETTSSTVGDLIGVNVTATNVASSTLMWVRKSGGGQFRYRFNSGSWTNVDTSNATDDLGSVVLTSPAGAHTLTLEVLDSGTTGVTLLGASMLAATGLVVHRLARGGTTATNWAAANAVRTAAWALLAVDITQVMLGTNDQQALIAPDTTYRTALTSIVTWLRSLRAGADVAIVSVPENLSTTAGIVAMSQYRDAAQRAAFDNACAFVDMWLVWGASSAAYDQASPRVFMSTADNIHPQANGYLCIGGALRRFYGSRI